MDFTRITADSARIGGARYIRNLRIPVATVVDMVAEGMTTAMKAVCSSPLIQTSARC